MSKPKVAFYWCASCGGCEEAVVDLNETILEVVKLVDIVFWPVALDFKRGDVEAMPDKSIDACFINGAIRSSEQFEMVEMLRKKSKLIVAFGSCAHLGGIPGLANLFDHRAMFEEAYLNVPSVTNPEKVFPRTETQVAEGKLSLPESWDTVKALNQVIDVDYFLPGCAPPPNLIAEAVMAIVKGQLPPKGAVLAPDVALCNECKRKDTKPEKISLTEFKRPSETIIDPEKCILAQGVICLGPVTRKGCGAACGEGNMPCTGCLGPTSNVYDYGAKALSAMASIIDAKEEKEIEAVLSKVVDPLGTFNRYSLPSSYLHRHHDQAQGGGK